LGVLRASTMRSLIPSLQRQFRKKTPRRCQETGFASSHEATGMSRCPRPTLLLQQRCTGRWRLQPEGADPVRTGGSSFGAHVEKSRAKCSPPVSSPWLAPVCRPPSFNARTDVSSRRRVEMPGASSRKSKSKGASSSPDACRFISFSPVADLPSHPVATESGHGAVPVLFMFGAPVGAHGPLPQRPAHVIASSTESEGQQPSSNC
jgi:hypothetical protein